MKLRNASKPLMLALASLTLIVVLTQLTSCGKSDPVPSAQDVVKGKLINTTWKIHDVTVDDVDKTSIYTGLTLQFTAADYSSANGKPVWPTNGTWTFTSADAKTIKRDDGIEITVDVSSDNVLKLSLNWPTSTLGGGRASSIKGVNVFTFTK